MDSAQSSHDATCPIPKAVARPECRVQSGKSKGTRRILMDLDIVSFAKLGEVCRDGRLNGLNNHMGSGGLRDLGQNVFEDAALASIVWPDKHRYFCRRVRGAIIEAEIGKSESVQRSSVSSRSVKKDSRYPRDLPVVLKFYQLTV